MRKLFVVALTSEVDLFLLKDNGFDVENLKQCCFTGKKENRGEVKIKTWQVLNAIINVNDVCCITNGCDDVLFTGIGKINATYALTKYLCDFGKPDVIYNIGTAGCCNDKIVVGDLVLCNKFMQLDMNATPQHSNEIGFTPYDDVGFVIDNSYSDDNYFNKINNIKKGDYICATMDTFNITDTKYDVYDMEAYALAKVSLRFGVDFICIKYITDNIMKNKIKKTDEDWKLALNDGRNKLTRIILNCL